MERRPEHGADLKTIPYSYLSTKTHLPVLWASPNPTLTLMVGLEFLDCAVHSIEGTDILATKCSDNTMVGCSHFRSGFVPRAYTVQMFLSLSRKRGCSVILYTSKWTMSCPLWQFKMWKWGDQSLDLVETFACRSITLLSHQLHFCTSCYFHTINYNNYYVCIKYIPYIGAGL